MPAWDDQDDEEQPERVRAVPLKWVPEQSAQPCGCDPGCKPKPHYCWQHQPLDEVPQIAKDIARAMVGDITTSDEQLEEALFPQDQSAISSVLGDTCPRCGGQLEQHEGLERDYPSCPRCR